MKICLINSLYKPYKRGGAEVVFSNIVKELKKDGHDVFIITISRHCEKKNFFITMMDDIKVYRFYPRNIFSFVEINKQPFWKRFIWHILDTFNYHSYRQVKKILQLEKPELVLSHNLKGIGYLTPRAIRSLNIKNIHTLHDVQLVYPSGLILYNKNWSNWLSIIYSKICNKLFNNPQTVVSPSKWLLDFYHQRGFFKKSKEVVLPNPIILEEASWHKNLDNKKINYLFLGQLEKHKGILFLLDVFSEFNKQKDCRLYIVGTGSLEEELKKKYENDDWVEFLGFISANLLGKEVFKRIHYTIIPSLCYENSPSVIYDSYKFATPVIASAIGGIPELVQEGVNGYLFEPGNKFSLLNKLNLSKNNIANFSHLSENAKIRAEEFDIKKYIYKLLSL
ncbi:glycosyltransferase family 4 protein [Candidatus Falkowbacteria bacterium]|nr:glycosyltransferase family 4 protein [Candidatus Falkowbacteria bacterium]